MGFLIPALAVMLLLIDFDLEDPWVLIKYSVVGGIVFIAISSIATREFTFKRWTDYLAVVTLAFFMSAYAYASLTFVNCHYDNSQLSHTERWSWTSAFRQVNQQLIISNSRRGVRGKKRKTYRCRVQNTSR